MWLQVDSLCGPSCRRTSWPIDSSLLGKRPAIRVSWLASLFPSISINVMEPKKAKIWPMCHRSRKLYEKRTHFCHIWLVTYEIGYNIQLETCTYISSTYRTYTYAQIWRILIKWHLGGETSASFLCWIIPCVATETIRWPGLRPPTWGIDAGICVQTGG